MKAAKAPPNQFGVGLHKVDDKITLIRMTNPVHGPITADQAVQWAAHLAAAAAPFTTISLGAAIKAIQGAKS